jgi:hypothetical protein
LQQKKQTKKHLTGDAKLVYNTSATEQKMEIKTICDLLTTEFGMKQEQYMELFKNRKLQPREKPKIFALAFQDLLEKALPSLQDTEKVDS